MSQTKVKSGLIDFTEGIDSFIEFSGGNSTVTGDLTVSGTLTGYTPTSGLNISNWNTAYGWGNHASAGYLTSFDITTQTDSKYLRSDESDTMSGSLTANGISSIGQEQAFTWQRTTGTPSAVYSLNADSGSAYLYNNTTSDVLMLWAEGGRVLINTTTDIGDPFYLQVNGRIMQTGTEFLFSGDQDKSITVYNNRSLYLRTNDTTRVTISGGGYVGINNTNPTNFLTVSTNLGGSPANLSELEPYATVKIKARSDRDNILYIGAKDALTGVILQSGTTSAGHDLLLNPFGGNVGIGTDSPGQLLTLGGSASVQMALRSSTNTGSSEIYFGDSDSVYRGFIGYYHSGDYLDFHTAGSYKMRITSDGNVGIGVISPDTKLHVVGTDGSGARTSPLNVLTITGENGNSPYDGFGGAILFTNRIYDGGPSPGGIREGARIRTRINTNSSVNYGTDLIFENTATGDGTLQPVMALRFNGAVAIGTLDPSDYKLRVLSSGSTGIRVDTVGSTFASPSINARNGTVDTVLSATSNGLEIGTWSNNDIIFKRQQSERARITVNGITFNGDTAAANALDDYEEGTFTPTLAASGSTTFSQQFGYYVKIGSIVTIHVYLDIGTLDGSSSSNPLVVGNLPFTSFGTYASISSIHCNSWSSTTKPDNGLIAPGYNQVDFYKVSGQNNVVTPTYAEFGLGNLLFSATYRSV